MSNPLLGLTPVNDGTGRSLWSYSWSSPMDREPLSEDADSITQFGSKIWGYIF